MKASTDLGSYDNFSYHPGASKIKRVLWYVMNVLWFKSSWVNANRWKCFLLRLFGAKVGKGLVIKPTVNIKYPWFLEIGDHVWIGEKVWIDNLDLVKIGNNVCISQEAMLLCGNHNYKLSSFDLITKEIIIENGAWIGARSTVTPGVRVGSHAILTVGSVTSGDLDPYTIYRGNPAVEIRKRNVEKKELSGDES